jgi:hypothetical protein
MIVIKAIAHDEETPRHWFDALGIVARGDVDWTYLVQRASRGPRRVMSLLMYALSIDLIVAPEAVRDLERAVLVPLPGRTP